MTKQEVVQKLQEIIGEEKVSKSEAARIFDAFVEMIVETVKNDDSISFNSYFKIFKKHRNERTAINPQTKEKMTIPAKDVIGFKLLSKGKTALQ